MARHVLLIGATLLILAALTYVVYAFHTYQTCRRRIRAEQEARVREERHTLQQAVIDAEQRCRAIAESSHELILVTDPGGAVRFANTEAREVFGDSLKPFECVPLSVREDVRVAFLECAAGRAATFEATVGREGRERALSFNAVPYGERGTIAGVIVSGRDLTESCQGIMADITERKVAEEALEQSRAKFRDLVEITTDWVWEVDPNGVYTYAGPRVREILGYEPEEVIGRTPFDFMPPNEAERIRVAFGSAAAERKPFALIENVNIHRNGTPVILETSGVPVFAAGGEFIGYRGIDRDVTAREENKHAHRRLAVAIDQSTEAVIITDRDGHIQYVNPAFETISGYRRDEVVGLTPRILKSGIQSDELYSFLWTQLISGNPWSGRFVNRRKNGTTYEVEASISPIITDEGEIQGFIGLQHDMTEHVALLERLHRAEEMERVGRLISGVAHEVRNPLNAIQAALSALELDLDEREGNQPLFRAIRSQVTRLADLMRELLEFSKPVEPSRMETCSVNMLCTEAIAIWRSSHPDQANGRVRFEPLAIDEVVEVEPARMHQVLINLLDNAHQHSPMVGQLAVASERDHGYLRIKVVDCGTGIKPEHAPKVFDPFFTTRRGGTGLGLGLVKNIVEQYGGRVTIRNNDSGPGCTAEIILSASAAGELDDASETPFR